MSDEQSFDIIHIQKESAFEKKIQIMYLNRLFCSNIYVIGTQTLSELSPGTSHRGNAFGTEKLLEEKNL